MVPCVAHHRQAAGSAGVVFHAMNRGVRRWRLFEQDADYQTCLQVLGAAASRYPVRIYSYCLMPNHFHLVLSPVTDGALSRFMQWFTATHSRRWHWQRGTGGTGAVYQGRFKAFPVQTDSHFLTVCRYVERNPVRAGLVLRAEAWPWSSSSQRLGGRHAVPLSVWPVSPDVDLVEWVNRSDSGADVVRVRRSVAQAIPYGSERWVASVAESLKLWPAWRPLGRPRK